MRNYYPGITLFKLTGALLVVTAHALLIPLMQEVPEQQYQFALLALRIIVPCFYVVSGFLVYQGWTHAAVPGAYVRKYATRIGVIYGFFCFLFMIRFTFPALQTGGLGLSNLFLQTKILVYAVFLNGPFLQLWYIPPLLFGVLISYWLWARNRLLIGMIAAGVGYAICQLISGSLRAFPHDFPLGPFSLLEGYQDDLISLFTRYFGFGLTFVLLGAVLARKEQPFLRLKPRSLWMPAIVLTLFETGLLLSFADWNEKYKLAFSLIPNTILLFYGILRVPLKEVQKYHKAINLFSIIAFVCHIPLMELNLFALDWDRASMSGLEGLIYLQLTLAECLAITWIWIKATGKKKSVAS